MKADVKPSLLSDVMTKGNMYSQRILVESQSHCNRNADSSVVRRIFEALKKQAIFAHIFPVKIAVTILAEEANFPQKDPLINLT